MSGSPASAFFTNAGTTAAARARGPNGMPKRRIVQSRPYCSEYDLQYISPASLVAV